MKIKLNSLSIRKSAYLRSLTIISILILGCYQLSLGQNNDQEPQKEYIEISLESDSTFTGELIAINDTAIIVRALNDLEAKNISIPIATVLGYTRRGAKWINRNTDGKVEVRKHQEKKPPILATQSMLGLSGYSLEKGKGYYQNILLLGNFAGYGISDKLSIEGGFELFSSVSTPIGYDSFSNIEKTPAILIASKYKLWDWKKELRFHAGALVMRGPYSNTLLSAGSLFGEGTYGVKRHRISMGLGLVVHKHGIGKNLLLMASGTCQVFNRIALIGSGWYFRNDDLPNYYYMLGLRFEVIGVSFDVCFSGIYFGDYENYSDESVAWDIPQLFAITFPLGKREKNKKN
ncbi:MAG: hypothetical protein AB8F74_05635 [Saprospiraceae bacterium]